MKRTIEISDEDLGIIAQALGEIPYRVAAPVIGRISEQVQESDDEADVSPDRPSPHIAP